MSEGSNLDDATDQLTGISKARGRAIAAGAPDRINQINETEGNVVNRTRRINTLAEANAQTSAGAEEGVVEGTGIVEEGEEMLEAIDLDMLLALI